MNGQHTGNGQNTGWRLPRRFSVTVQRLARPPMPWTWAIYEDDATEPCHRSRRRPAPRQPAAGAPPMPGTWAIYEDDATEPCHRSRRFYRSAEEAWAVGRAI